MYIRSIDRYHIALTVWVFLLAACPILLPARSDRLTSPTLKCTTIQPYHPEHGIEITHRVLDDLAHLRPSMLRVEFIGEYDPQKNIRYQIYDYLVDELARRDIAILGLIDYQSVAWSDRAEWATEAFRKRFVQRTEEIVARYARRANPIRHWEIWNEQDIAVEGFNVRIEPEPYARILIEAYHAIKAIDPGATVVFGGLSSKGFEYEENYLADVYATQPIRDHHRERGYHPFDVVAVHPYPEIFKNPNPGMGNLLNTKVKAVMNANGDRHKKVWLTEMGWATCRSHNACVTEKQQADFLTSSFLLCESLRDPAFPDDPPYVERYFWFKYDSFSPDDEWGLVSRNRARRKPSYFAFLNLTEPGPEPTRPPVVPGEFAPVWGAVSDSALPVRVANDDLLEGMLPTRIEGSLPAEAVGGVAALTNGLFDANPATLRLADHARPALRLRYEFPAPVHLEEVRVFAGHLGEGGYRAFQSNDIYINGAPAKLELNTGDYEQVSPSEDGKSGTAVSVVRWRAPEGQRFVATNVRILEIVAWATSSYNFDFRDRWCPVLDSTRDNEGAGPAYYAPILKEIDAIGVPAASVNSSGALAR